jgi:hypothetical protein
MSIKNITIKNINDYQLNKILKICNIEKLDYSIELLNKNIINPQNDIVKTHWNGPYKCLIPISLDCCVAEDGGNTLYQNRSKTEMCIMPELTKQEWLAQYADYNEDDKKYYYKI